MIPKSPNMLGHSGFVSSVVRATFGFSSFGSPLRGGNQRQKQRRSNQDTGFQLHPWSPTKSSTATVAKNYPGTSFSRTRHTILSSGGRLLRWIVPAAADTTAEPGKSFHGS